MPLKPFYQPGDKWREMYPFDYQVATEELIAREAQERHQMHRDHEALDPVCLICSKLISPAHPDQLVVSETGQKGLAHHDCKVPSRDRHGNKVTTKYRHCVGGYDPREASSEASSEVKEEEDEHR